MVETRCMGAVPSEAMATWLAQMERRTARKKTEKGASPLDRVWAWLGWFRVDIDRKDGPRKERMHSLSHSKHFTNLNLG
jgi:hypothetical protein